MFHGFPKLRRAPRWSPRGEQLEGRALLTGAGGSSFALAPTSIDKPGDSVSETFKIDPAHFTIPTKVILGIDVAALSGSTVKPKISSVSIVTPAAAATKATETTVGAEDTGEATTTAATAIPETLSPLTLTRAAESSAVLVQIAPMRGRTAPQEYATTVTADAETSGKLLIGYYLPGDADGDGQVTQKDLRAVMLALGSKAGDSRYNFDADANRDGKIDQRDFNLARANLGVQTKIQASITANLDPASDSGTLDRITVYQDVIFEGNGTPGAQLTFSEVDQKTPEYHAMVKADGTYSLTIPLAEGSNTFKVTSVDAFGQEISGTLTPVTYQKPATLVTSPTEPTSPPKALYPTTTTTTPTGIPGRLNSAQLAALRRIAPHGDQATQLRARLAMLQNARAAMRASSATKPTAPTSGTTRQGIAYGEYAPGTTPVNTTPTDQSAARVADEAAATAEADGTNSVQSATANPSALASNPSASSDSSR